MSVLDIDIRDVFFDEIYDIASKDKDVVFITADADAFSLRKYKNDFPNQFINIGVAEQNMVTVATGLALSGKKVFIYAIIPFITMRCLEHLKVNVCSMNLPITIVGAGAGLSFGNDGPTHHAVCDIAIMRTLPEITIFNPSDSATALLAARLSYKSTTPVYVRIDKGKLPVLHDSDENFSDGFSVVKKGRDISIVATGIMVNTAKEIAEELAKEDIDVGVIDLYRIKPIDQTLFLKALENITKVVSLEENVFVGGIGSIISEIFTDNHKSILLKRIALKDEQCFYYGSREYLHKIYEIDKDSILKKIIEFNRNN